MKVILKEDVPNLGNMGDTVTVKPGYGRNYLIPRGLALLADTGNAKELAHVVRQIEAKREALRASAQDVSSRLDGLSITLTKQAGDEDKLYGSVTNRDVHAALAAQGFDVDRRRIIVKDPIKTLGIYAVPVKLHADVEAEVKVWVCAM